MRVIVVGAGAIGRQVVADLSRGEHEVVVVDTDDAVCEQIAAEYDALVIHGDATEPEILEKAQVGEADALVAVTGADPINTVVAILAHRYDVEKIIVKITTNALRGALEEVGVSEIVAPTMAAAANIELALTEDENTRADVELLAQGSLQVVEVRVGPSAHGKRVSELGLPRDVMPVIVVRGDDAKLARPESGLEKGDVLVVVADGEKAARSTKEALEGD